MTSLTLTGGAPARDRFELAGLLCLVVFVAALQVSIAAAQILLGLVVLCWIGTLAVNRQRPVVPRFFWPLAAYAAVSLVSAAFSMVPAASLQDSKQLLLFLIVPAVFHLGRGRRAALLMDVIISVAGLTALVGIVQYGVLEYNFLGKRPHGTMGHYMTYSGLLMLVIAGTASRLLFGRSGRMWPALVMPALAVALALTLTRNAWVGAGVAVCLLLALKDLRLLVVFPVVGAVLFFAFATPELSNRFYSMFNRKDPTSSDRLSMARAGLQMIADHPLTGVGPNVVERVYPQYRPADAVEPNQPHLHNVPLQVAAERGLPALAVWLWFIGAASLDAWRRFRRERSDLAAAALASVAGMLAAGLFEYNFGDSEFLMLFLVMLTLPLAAARATVAEPVPGHARPAMLDKE